MARIRRARSAVKKAGGFLKNKTSKDILVGVGSLKAGEIVGNKVGVSPIVPAALLAYFVGGSTGLMAAVATHVVSGGALGLGGLGTQNQSTPAGTVYN